MLLLSSECEKRGNESSRLLSMSSREPRSSCTDMQDERCKILSFVCRAPVNRFARELWKKELLRQSIEVVQMLVSLSARNVAGGGVREKV